MSAPPWGHKPPAVDDATRYWTQPPAAPSPRCLYWLHRHDTGTWQPNRRLRTEDYHTAAEHLGIWIWEYLHLIRPLFDEEACADPLTSATPCT